MKNIAIALILNLVSFSSLADGANKVCPTLTELGDKIFKEMNQTRPQVKVKKTIKIAVIDTGIDFNNKSLQEKIWVPGRVVSKNKFGLNFVDDNSMPQDTHGHGTHISGIILGLFPEAKVFPIKYYSPKISGEKNLENLIKGMRAAIDAQVDIINISAGGPHSNLEELELIKEAKRKNILIVSAAGNEGYQLSEKNTYYPAQYAEENILSVLNLNKQGFLHHKSNYGKEIQLGTLGTVISYGLGECEAKMTGTSQATAVVSALAAMIKAENPHLSYKELKAKVLENTVLSVSSYPMISFSKLAKKTPAAKAQVANRVQIQSNLLTSLMSVFQ